MTNEELDDLCGQLSRGDAFAEVWDVRDRVNTSGSSASNEILDHYALVRFGRQPRNAASTHERYITREERDRLLAAGALPRGTMRDAVEPATRFVGDVAGYADLLADVELACSDVDALRGQTFTVEVLPNFESLAQAQFAAAHRASEAAYIPSRDVIAINQEVFDKRTLPFQKSVVLHEMAHAIRHRRGVAATVGDCGPADAEVVRWGVGDEEYIAIREIHQGPQYGALLRSVPGRDPADVEEALEAWARQVRAGIIVRPKR